MAFEWDEEKRLANLAKHGIDFADAETALWRTAVIEVDVRRDYGELREIAYVLLQGRVATVVFTKRNGAIRLISMRWANRQERQVYHDNS